MAMLVRTVRAFAHDNVGFLERAATNEFERKRLADGFGAELPVNVFKPSDGMARESHKNIADNHAGLVR